METPAFLTGQFLLATPGMADPRFARSMIAMCTHDTEGAVGIGVGATHDDLGFHDLLRQFEIDPGDSRNAPVHVGGPCEPRRGFILHSRDWGGQDTLNVAGRWAMSTTLDALRAIAEGRGPTHWLIALGYAGWGEGQLEGELTGAGWFNVAGDATLLWDVPAEERWSRGFAAAGIDPRLMVGSVGRA